MYPHEYSAIRLDGALQKFKLKAIKERSNAERAQDIGHGPNVANRAISDVLIGRKNHLDIRSGN